MTNFLKGTKLYSILTGSCPVCHKDKMYIEGNPYKLGQIFDMYKRCKHCNTKYKMEPSFFFGAMYVSYGLGIAFSVAAFVISHYLLGSSLMTAFLVIVGTLIVFFPIIARLSRNIWINLFISYDPNK